MFFVHAFQLVGVFCQQLIVGTNQIDLRSIIQLFDHSTVFSGPEGASAYSSKHPHRLYYFVIRVFYAKVLKVRNRITIMSLHLTQKPTDLIYLILNKRSFRCVPEHFKSFFRILVLKLYCVCRAIASESIQPTFIACKRISSKAKLICQVVSRTFVLPHHADI